MAASVPATPSDFPHRTGNCPSGDVTLHYRIFGQRGATPLLIVHGLSYFSYDWIGIAAKLASDREVVVMDMRGFGDSTWSPTQDYTLPAFAGDIRALMGHLGWDKAILVGHSMGGRNTTFTASRHPELVEKLVLVDYSPVNAKEGGTRVMNTIAGIPDVFASVDAAMAYFGADTSVPAGHPLRQRYEAYLKPADGGYIVKRDDVFRSRFRRQKETGEREPLGADLWEELGKVTCPILVVRGTRSDMFAAETVEKVKVTNNRVTLVELDAGHDVGGDDPDGLIREIKAFV